MELVMKEIGSLGNIMVLEFCTGLMEATIKAIGGKEKKTGKECLQVTMEIVMKGNGSMESITGEED